MTQVPDAISGLNPAPPMPAFRNPQEADNPYVTERAFRDLVRQAQEEQRTRDAAFLLDVASQGRLQEFNAAQLQQAAGQDMEQALAVLQQGMTFTGEGWRVPEVGTRYGDLIADLERQSESASPGQFTDQFAAIRQQAGQLGAFGQALATDERALAARAQDAARARGSDRVGANLAETIIAEITMGLEGSVGDRRARAVRDVVDSARNLARARYDFPKGYQMPGGDPRAMYGVGSDLDVPFGQKVDGMGKEQYEASLMRGVVADLRNKLRENPDLDPGEIAGFEESFINEAARYGAMLLPIGVGAGTAGKVATKGFGLVKKPLEKVVGSVATKVLGKATTGVAQSATLFGVMAAAPTDAAQQEFSELITSEMLPFGASEEEIGDFKRAARVAARFKNGAMGALMMPMFAIAGPAAGLAGRGVGAVAGAALGKTAGNVIGHVGGSTAMGAAMPAMMELGSVAADELARMTAGFEDSSWPVIDDLARAARMDLIVDDDPIKPVQSFAAALAQGDVDAMQAAAEEYGRRTLPAMAGFGAFGLLGAAAGVGAQNLTAPDRRRRWNNAVDVMAESAKQDVAEAVGKMDEAELRQMAEGDETLEGADQVDTEALREQVVEVLQRDIDARAEEAKAQGGEQTDAEKAAEIDPAAPDRIAEDETVTRLREAAGEEQRPAGIEAELAAAEAGTDVGPLASMPQGTRLGGRRRIAEAIRRRQPTPRPAPERIDRPSAAERGRTQYDRPIGPDEPANRPSAAERGRTQYDEPIGPRRFDDEVQRLERVQDDAEANVRADELMREGDEEPTREGMEPVLREVDVALEKGAAELAKLQRQANRYAKLRQRKDLPEAVRRRAGEWVDVLQSQMETVRDAFEQGRFERRTFEAGGRTAEELREDADAVIAEIEHSIGTQGRMQIGARPAGERVALRRMTDTEGPAAAARRVLDELAGVKPAAPKPEKPKPFTSDDLAAAQGRTESLIGGKPMDAPKRFIADLWKTVQAERPDAFESLDAFKKWVLGEARAGRVRLTRADLVEAMDPATVRDSEIADLMARFHFAEVQKRVETPEQARVAEAEDAPKGETVDAKPKAKKPPKMRDGTRAPTLHGDAARVLERFDGFAREIEAELGLADFLRENPRAKASSYSPARNRDSGPWAEEFQRQYAEFARENPRVGVRQAVVEAMLRTVYKRAEADRATWDPERQEWVDTEIGRLPTGQYFNAMHGGVKRGIGNVPTETFKAYVERMAADFEDARELAEDFGDPTTFHNFRESYLAFFEGVESIAARYSKEAMALLKKVERLAVQLRHPNEGGAINIGVFNPRHAVQPVVGFAHRLWAAFSDDTPAKKLIDLAGADPKRRFTRLERWAIKSGLANPMTYGGKIASDAIRTLAEAAGAYEQHVVSLFGDRGMLRGIKEGDEIDTWLWNYLDTGDEIEANNIAGRVVSKDTINGRTVLELGNALKSMLEQMRVAAAEVHPGVRRMRQEIGWMRDIMLKREAEYQRIDAEQRQAVAARSQIPEWQDLQTINATARQMGLRIDELPPDVRRERGRLNREVHIALSKLGLKRPEQYAAIKAGITAAQNRMKTRRAAMAGAVRDTISNWGFRNYVHHVLRPDATPDDVQQFFSGPHTGSDYGHRTSWDSLESRLETRRKVGARFVKRRRDMLRESGLLSTSAVRSLWAYIGQFPIYTKRMEFLGRWDEYLWGRLDSANEIDLPNGKKLNEAFAEAQEVIYDGARARSLGFMVSLPRYNKDGERIGNSLHPVKDIDSSTAEFADLNTLAQQVAPDWYAALKKKTPGGGEPNITWRQLQREVQRQRAFEAGSRAEDRSTLEDFEGVLLWHGDPKDRPSAKELADPQKVKRWMEQDVDAQGNARKNALLTLVPADVAKMEFRFWRDGYYGELLKAAQQSHTGDELLAAKTLAEFIERQFVGGMQYLSAGQTSMLSDAATRGEQMVALVTSLVSMNAIGGPTNVRNAVQAGIGGAMFAYATMGRLPSRRAFRAMKSFGQLEKKMNAVEEGLIRKVARFIRDRRPTTPEIEVEVRDGRVVLDAELDGIIGTNKPHQGPMTEQRAAEEGIVELFRSHVMGGNRGDQLARNLMQVVRASEDGRIGRHLPRWAVNRDRAQGRIDRPGSQRDIIEWWKALNNTFWAPFNAAERYARALPFLDVFIERRMEGRTREQAAADAFYFVHSTQMVYSRASKPKLLLHPVGRLFGALATWSVHAQGRVMQMGAKDYAKLFGRLYAWQALGLYLGVDLARMLMAQSTDIDTGVADVLTGQTEGEWLTGILGGVGIPTDEDPWGMQRKGPVADGSWPNVALPWFVTGMGATYGTLKDLGVGLMKASQGQMDTLDETVGAALATLDPTVHANYYKRLQSAAKAGPDDTGSWSYVDAGVQRKDFTDLARMAEDMGIPEEAFPFVFWMAQQLPFTRESRSWIQGTITAQEAKYREGLERRATRRSTEIAEALAQWEAAETPEDRQLAQEALGDSMREWAELRNVLGQTGDPRTILQEGLRRARSNARLPGHLRSIGRMSGKQGQVQALIGAVRDRAQPLAWADFMEVMRSYIRADSPAGLSTVKPETRAQLVEALQERMRWDEGFRPR